MKIYQVGIFDYSGNTVHYLFHERQYSKEEFDNLIANVLAECAVIEDSDYWASSVMDMAIELLIRNYGFKPFEVNQSFWIDDSFRLTDKTDKSHLLLLQEKYNQKLKEKRSPDKEGI